MNTYRVTFEFDGEQLTDFMEKAPLGATVKVEVVERPGMPMKEVAPRDVIRRKRGSKVIDTILETLKGGQSGTHALKQDLSKAGLSAGSLSTGLAILQKNGKIMRTEDGYYALVDAA